MRRTAVTAASAALAVALLSAPVGASASTIYPPSGSCTTTPSTFTAGGTVEFACSEGTFSADEQVTITVTGENGANVRFAHAKFAVSTGSTVRQATSAGALDAVSITFPADASGVYNIEAISPTSAGGTASASLTTADGLPATGGNADAVLGMWVGGGALVAAGVAIAAITVVRRRADRI